MDQEQIRRENLYKKFREAASTGEIPSNFDENDLIDIYDNANDNYDEAVQLQVIFAAVRYFPDSDELMQRRAYFLLEDLSMSDTALSIAENRHEDSALWELLVLRVKRPSGQEAADAMSAILNRYDDYDDETIIQLVTTFSELGLLDWLKDHKDVVQQRCRFKDTFLYELAQEAEEQGDCKYAAKLLTELTDMEPFNSTYWHMLSQEYINIGDYDNALSSIEYAVAISPDSAPILTTKAQILFDLNKNGQEAYRIVRDIVAHDKEYTPALFTLAAMYAIDGNEEGAASIVEEYLAEHPSEGEAIGHLLKLGDSLRNLRVLREYLHNSGKSQEEWTAWARTYYDQGLWQPTSDILLTWLYSKGVSGDWNMLIESLYRQKRIGEITQLYREYLLKIDDPMSVNISFTTFMMLIFAMLRAGQIGTARHMADFMLSADISNVGLFENRMQLIGAQSILRSMLDVFNGETIVDLDKIDPFITTSEPSGAPE
jgi:tetratricopeptide (TPR) repeat protein